MTRLDYLISALFISAMLLLGAAVITARQMQPPSANPSASKDKLNPIIRLVKNGKTFCSGSVVSDHVIITAAHCVLVDTIFGYMPSPDAIEIRADDDVPRNITARIIYVTGQMDQAMLIGDFTQFEHKPIIFNFNKLNAIGVPRQEFIACGYPLGGDLVCSDLVFKHKDNFFWAVSGSLYPGMSGGPAMLPDGTLVAVNTAVKEEFSIISPIYNLTKNLRKP